MSKDDGLVWSEPPRNSEDDGLVWSTPGGTEAPVTGPARGAWSDVWSGVGRGLEASGAATIGALTDDRAIQLRAGRLADERRAFEERATQQGLPGSIGDVSGPVSAAQLAARGLVSSSPSLALYGAGSLAGPAGLAAAVGGNLAMRGGENMAERIAAGQDPNAAESYMYAVPQTALDIGGSGLLIRGGAAGAVARDLGGGIGRRTLAGAAVEAGEQAGIGAASGGFTALGQGRDITRQDLVEGAAVGALMGAPFGAAHGMRARAIEATPVKPATEGSTDLTVTAAADTYTGKGYDRPTYQRRGGGDIYARDAADRNGGQYTLPLREREGGRNPQDAYQGPLPAERELSGDQLELFQPQQADLGLEGGSGPRRPPEAPTGPIRPADELSGTQGGFDFEQAPRRARLFSDQDAIAALSQIAPQQQANGAPVARGLIQMPGVQPTPNPAAQIQIPQGSPRQMPALPPRARELMLRAAANEPRRVEVPSQQGGFSLRGQTPEQLRALSRQFEEEARRMESGLQPQEGNAGQRELDLQPQAEQPRSNYAPEQGELLAPTQGGQSPWQQQVRDAWKRETGSMQGIQGLAKILKAADAEEAAGLVRDKAEDSSATSFTKLDAIHKALTGESLEEHAARQTREQIQEATDATQTRKEPEGGKQQHQDGNEGGQAAEAGGGNRDEQGGDGKVARSEESPAAVPEEVKLPEQGVDTPARGMDAITLAREQAAESRPGLMRMVKDIEKQLGLPGETPKQRRERIETLSHIAHLERDKAAVDRAREALDDMTTDEEKSKALQSTAEEAALRINQDIRGEFREQQSASKDGGGHDREIFEAAAKKTDARGLIERIAADHPNEAVRALAQHLLDRESLDGVTVRHGTEAERRGAPEGVLGESRGNDILLHSMRDAAQTVLHEAVHTATVRALDAGGPAALEMRRLYAEAQKVDGLAKEYGLKNVKEFVAEAFSNPEFRSKLDAIKLQGGTLWERFKAAVAKMLGIKDKSLLDAVLEQRDALSKEQAATVRSDGDPKALYRQATEGGATGRGHAASDGLRKIYDDAAGTGKSAKELASKINIATMPTHIIAKTYDHVLPGIKSLSKLMDDRANSIGERQRKVVDVSMKIEEARKAAGSKHLERLHSVIGDVQVSGVHPARAGTLDDLRTARDAAVKAAKGAGNDLAGLRAKEDARKAVAAFNAREQWEAMTKQERDALDAGFDALEQSQADRYNVLRKLVGEKDSPFFQQRGPYAPLKRYGDWIVSVKSQAMQAAEAAVAAARESGDKQALKDATERVALMNRDPDHRAVFGVENASEAEEKAAQLKAAIGEGAEVHSFTRQDFFKKDTGHRDVLVSDILARLDDEFAGSPELDAIKRMVEDAYVERLPDGSAASMSAHRQLVQGWSQDFSRAIIDRLGRDAFQIGTLEYGKRLADALKTVDQERRTVGTSDASAIYDAFAGRLAHENTFSKFAKAERMVAEATHVFYLGASPAFMLMNMLQTPMIAVPVIAGKFGFGRAMGGAMRAMQDVWKLFDRNVGLKVADAKHLTPEEKLMIGRMENLGLIDLTSAHTSARMARGERIIDPKGAKEKTMAAGQRLKELLNVPVQYIESVNRGGTALAAYRLAREGGVRGRSGAKMDHDAAMRYAADVLRDSHVDYTSQANPTFFRIPGARILFQFQKYGLTMFHMLSRTMFDAYGHPKDVKDLRQQLLNKNLPEDRRATLQEKLDGMLERRGEARRTLTGVMAMHQLMVGAMGLPFSGLGFSAADVLRNWAGDDEDQHDTRVDFQNYLADAFGTDAATLVSRGIPAAVLGVDISRRVGLGDVAPFTQTLTNVTRARASGGGTTDLFNKQLVSLLGPAGGVGQQFARGMDKMGNGDYVEGAFQMMPRAIFNASEGIRMGGEGVEVAGKKVHEPLNTSDAFVQFLGLPATSVEQAKEAAYSARALTGRAGLVRNNLIKQAAEARAAGEAMPEEVQAFNQRNPGLRITQGDIIKHQRKEAGGGTIKPPRPGSVQAELARRWEEQSRYATDEE